MSILPSFRRHRIYTGPPGERTSCVVGDLNSDGIPEVVIATRAPQPQLHWLGRNTTGEWDCHLIDDTFDSIGVGGALIDLNGNGRPDLIAGSNYRGNHIYWWECPEDPTERWQRREVFRMPAGQTHDQIVADIDGDGRPELYFWNQGSRSIFWAPIPDDPYVFPWPNMRTLVTGVNEEGMSAADVDGDGRLELIAGQSWYRLLPNGEWERHIFAEGFVSPKSVAADFDGDGRIEIVLSEGDASLNGREFGRVALFKAGSDPEALWEPEVLHDRLLEPHALQVADFDGDGLPDLFVGEMGMPDGRNPHPPAQRIYLSRGNRMEEHVIDEGVATHEAKVIVLDGRVGIVGKPFRVIRDDVPRGPDVDGVHLWLPENERGVKEDLTEEPSASRVLKRRNA